MELPVVSKKNPSPTTAYGFVVWGLYRVVLRLALWQGFLLCGLKVSGTSF